MAEEKSAKRSPLQLKGKSGSKEENRPIQLLIVLALAGCCFVAFLQYKGTTELIQAGNNYQPNIDPTKLDMSVQGEAEEVKQTGDAASSLTRADSQVMQSAMLAAASGKQPFGTSNTLVPPPPPPGTVADVPVEVIEPPAVTVRAVMVRGSERIAVIDVDGTESGLVVREGSRFSDDSARITKINPEGVMFTWMQKSYEATIPR